MSENISRKDRNIHSQSMPPLVIHAEYEEMIRCKTPSQIHTALDTLTHSAPFHKLSMVTYKHLHNILKIVYTSSFAG